MNSNKKINLLVDAVKLALIIFIACALVSLIVLLVSDDPMTAITSLSDRLPLCEESEISLRQQHRLCSQLWLLSSFSVPDSFP